MRLIINTDGGARGNPGPAAAAFVISDDAEKIWEKRGKYLGVATNNEAEYRGVIEALEFLTQNTELIRDVSQLDFYLDSNLVVNQLAGQFKIKEERLRALFMRVKDLLGELQRLKVTYTHVPREKNWLADQAVNEVLDASKEN